MDRVLWVVVGFVIFVLLILIIVFFGSRWLYKKEQ